MMLIKAIAIYQISDNLKYLKIISAPKYDLNLFSYNCLETATSILEPFLATDEVFYIKQQENDWYHLQKLKNPSILILIISQKPLEKTEILYLFKNIFSIYRNKTVHKLDDVIKNPFGFTRGDLLIGNINSDLKEMEEQLSQIALKLKQSKNKLEELSHKTNELKICSEQFAASKKDKCC